MIVRSSQTVPAIGDRSDVVERITRIARQPYECRDFSVKVEFDREKSASRAVVRDGSR